MQVVRDIEALRETIDRADPGGGGPAFVPTMGALHEGHRRLIVEAGGHGRPVVVSIFVNPTQFAPGEDLDRYPRPFGDDLVACLDEGVDVVFAPAVETVYPPDRPPPPTPLPPVATEPGLEGARRPGHFAGVCTVVSRLFDLVRPRRAIFGEKDYQQLLVIRQLVARSEHDAPERWPDLQIVSVPTVREADGLALSSRNRMIPPADRERALGLSRALEAARGAEDPASAERVMLETLDAHHLDIDYAVVRDAETLEPVTDRARPARALIAARLGSVRLIDNCAMGGG
jgi:pantoate--beta-alanine ligase